MVTHGNQNFSFVSQHDNEYAFESKDIRADRVRGPIPSHTHYRQRNQRFRERLARRTARSP